MTCDYNEIYSKFYVSMTDPEFYKMDESYVNELMKTWLHIASAEPYIQRIFSELKLDDEMEEISFTLSVPINDDSDIEFVTSIFAKYMIIQWMKKHVDNNLHLAFILGGKEEKKIQSNYKNNIDRLDSLELKLRKYIRDYGYDNNEYLAEES